MSPVEMPEAAPRKRSARSNGEAAPGPQPAPVQAQPTAQLNPALVAQATLEFLQRCQLMPAERGRFGVCEQFLQGIASGQVVVAPAQ